MRLWPLFIVRRVAGRSMLPVLRPGTIVVAVPAPGNVQPGQVVIFRHDGREKIKRIIRIEENSLWLEGDNPDESTDSRQFGIVKTRMVRGRVIFPATRLKNTKRPPSLFI